MDESINMKQIGIGILCIMFLLFGSWFVCSWEKVPAGYVGVKVYLLGADKGVSDIEPLGIGRHWIGFQQELHLFPIFMQNVRWTEAKDDFSPHDEAIRFLDKNNMKITTDVGFSYTIKSDKVPHIFKRHRKGIEDITNVYIRNIVQNTFNVVGGQMLFEEICGAKKEEFLEKVASKLNTSLANDGFIIEHVTVLAMTPPPSVVSSINRKMQAQQDATKAIAEAQATVEKAKADATAIREKSRSITPMMIQYEAVMRWDGKLPKYMSGNSALPFLNVR